MQFRLNCIFYLFINYITDNHQTIIIFIIIVQLIYLILIIYFRHGRHVKVDKISPRKVIAYSNQVLDYIEVMLRLVIPRFENVDKMPKLNPKMNLGVSSDLGIGIPRLNLS